MTAASEDREIASAVVRKTMTGAVALGARQVVVQLLNVAGGVVLARMLSPVDFGAYAIASFALAFFLTFGDAGLGASLIRERDEPAARDLRAVFTAQQLLVCVVAVAVVLAAPLLTRLYGLPARVEGLFQLLALAFVLTSLQVIPKIQLERRLAFDRIAAIETLQAVAYNVALVSLAVGGAGVLSFGIAAVIRSAAGAWLAHRVSPWSMGCAWDWARIRPRLAYGIPYQGSAVVSLVKDAITPVLIGVTLGAAQVGYVHWAQMVAAYPVLALMILQRLFMPAFARLQHDQARLGPFVEGVIRASNAITAPAAVITLVWIEPLTRLVFGPQWLPAIPLFYLLWGANLFVPTAGPAAALLNAVGASRTTLAFTIVWMAGTWGIGAPLIALIGPMGFAAANLAVQLTNVALFRAAQRRVPFRILAVSAPYWALAIAVGALSWAGARTWPARDVFGLAAHLLAASGIYLAALAWHHRDAIRTIRVDLRETIRWRAFPSSSTP